MGGYPELWSGAVVEQLTEVMFPVMDVAGAVDAVVEAAAPLAMAIVVLVYIGLIIGFIVMVAMAGVDWMSNDGQRSGGDGLKKALGVLLIAAFVLAAPEFIQQLGFPFPEQLSVVDAINSLGGGGGGG